MRRTSHKKSAALDATFVFEGTIKKLAATNMKQARASQKTAIISVDKVIEAPPNLAAYTGQNITVELSGRRKFRAGDKLIVHAISWLFGDTIAVRSLFEEIEPQRKTAAKGRSQGEMAKHFESADAVVSGKVVEVRLPKTISAKRAAPASLTTKVSEHDPKWREAVIEVDQVHKGDSTRQKLVVRFPASTDVAWRRAPKLQAGQEGFFLLHKDEASPENRARKTGKTIRQSAQTFILRD